MIKMTVGQLYDRVVDYYGKELAIVHEEKRFSYEQMGDHANRVLTGLQQLGLGKGDKVALLMANCPEYLFCEYAIAKGGAIRIPLAVLLGEDDHIYMMNFTGCETLIYHPKYADRVERMMPKLNTVNRYICIGESPLESHLNLHHLIENNAPEPQPVELDSEDLAGIYFTGGTTGKPKGVMLSHRAWIYTYLVEMLEFGIDWDERFVFATPLTHAGGCLILPVLMRRGCCIILDHFDPDHLLATIETQRATATLLVPTMIYLLLDTSDTEQYDHSTLRNVLYGAAIIAPERLKQAVDRFGPVFTQFFGQTEAPMAMSVLPRAMHLNPDPVRERQIHSSAGRPTCHTRLKLMDDEGREVAQGECGEVVVQCANVMHGYYRNPEATSETIRDGWLYTGDVGYQDEQGFLYIVDRKKDLIISGGFNVYPREIEDVLIEHPAVRQAAVVGVPDAKWGEQVRAIVVLADNQEAEEEALIQYVKDKKGSLMAPKVVEFWNSIPLTNLGKVDKKAIRAICEGPR